MGFIKSFLSIVLLLGLIGAGMAAEVRDVAAVAQGSGNTDHGSAQEGLPAAAPVLLDLGYFAVTNSMLVTWIVALLVIGFAKIATSRIQDVPTGAQNFWEWMVEWLHDFLGGIMGKPLVPTTFWFFATVFIFILFTNWFGLLPGVGTIGWGVHSDGNLILPTFQHIHRPLLRGGNADLNMTSAISMIFFACWIYWAIRFTGVGGAISHTFGYRGDATGITRILLMAIFLAVGVLEVISILFRPVSLSFRLYGNIFAGENLLEAMAVMGGKWFGWLVPLPFYGLELIVGFVQALVFMLLTAIFTALICSHSDHEAHAHEGSGHGVGGEDSAGRAAAH